MIMKNQFIEALKQKHIPAQQNDELLQRLPMEQFGEFNAEVTPLKNEEHRWDSRYFDEQIEALAHDFSQEFCQHLIAVKQYLQNHSDRFNDFKVQDRISQIEAKVKQTHQARQDVSKPSLNDESEVQKFLADYQPDERLYGFLQTQEWSKARSALMSLLNNRRLNIKHAVKAMFYVYVNYPQVYEEYEVSAFADEINEDETAWNVDYFNLQQNYLNSNFSVERLGHLLNVREALMKKGDENFKQLESIAKSTTTTSKAATNAKADTQLLTSDTATTPPPKPTAQNTHSHQTNSQQSPQHTYNNGSLNQSKSSAFLKKALIVGGAFALVGIALLWWVFGEDK